jgi:hypothetical protein
MNLKKKKEKKTPNFAKIATTLLIPIYIRPNQHQNVPYIPSIPMVLFTPPHCTCSSRKRRRDLPRSARAGSSRRRFGRASCRAVLIVFLGDLGGV